MSQFTCEIGYTFIHSNQQMHQLHMSYKLVMDAINISVSSSGSVQFMWCWNYRVNLGHRDGNYRPTTAMDTTQSLLIIANTQMQIIEHRKM